MPVSSPDFDSFYSRMPIQAPQWTEFLSCPVCCNEFDVALRSPISLGCSHTICKACLSNLHRKQCPFDQTTISIDIDSLPVNTALLQLVGASSKKKMKIPSTTKLSRGKTSNTMSPQKNVWRNSRGISCLSPMEMCVAAVAICHVYVATTVYCPNLCNEN